MSGGRTSVANGDRRSDTVRLTGVNLSGQQTARVQYQIPPKDLLVFVPGTTDPINATAALHQANRTYWEENKPLFDKVRELKREYLDLHIMNEFFSWSGDNARAEREKAGNRLRELLYARRREDGYADPLYKGWIDRPVSLHLIGHSHGGNVINEFTRAIAAHGDFPRQWKIKSITYLSTPFFKKMHQVDTRHFHPRCRIVNVHNAYDLTQRVVADYTVRQLPQMLGAVQGDPDFLAARAGVGALDRDAFAVLGQLGNVIDDTVEGPRLWRAMLGVLRVVERGLGGARTVTAKLRRDFPDVISERAKGILDRFVTEMEGWVRPAIRNFDARLRNPTGWDKYNSFKFLDDLNLGPLCAAVDRLLAFNPATLSGQLFDLIDDILIGRVDVFDDTVVSPRAQIPAAYEVIDVPIRAHDRYHRLREAQFSRFITRLEATQQSYAAAPTSRLRMELVLQLIAQFDYSGLAGAIDGLDKLDWVVNDAAREQPLRRLQRTLTALRAELDTRNARIVVEQDRGKPPAEQRGSVVYLAFVSHSVSRADLWDEVRRALVPAFDSGRNPGYRVQPRGG